MAWSVKGLSYKWKQVHELLPLNYCEVIGGVKGWNFFDASVMWMYIPKVENYRVLKVLNV